MEILLFHFSVMNGTHLNRDICRKCNKYIYTHDFIVICHLEGTVYHGKCFKFNNNTSLEIQQQDNWACPDCVAAILPFGTEDLLNDDVMLTCTACIKFISKSRHKILTCSICSNIVHSSCSSESICNMCHNDTDCPIQSPTF